MDKKVAALAEKFAMAPMEEGGWLEALQALADATGSARGQLVGIGADNASWFNWITGGTTRDMIDAFETTVGHNPLANTRVRVSHGDPILTIRSEIDYRTVADDAYSRLYADLCHATGMPNGCQTILSLGEGSLIGLSMLRTEADGATQAEDRELFAAVAPYARSAVRMQIALEGQGARLAIGALDRISACAFVCGPGGKLLASTSAAEALLVSGRLTLVHGRLAAPSPRDDSLLIQAFARHGQPWSDSAPVPLETLFLGRDQSVEGGTPPMLIDVSALPRSGWRMTPGTDMLVLIRSGKQWHEAAPRLLKSAYGLSAAEIDVAFRLAGGQTREEIARERGASLETVKAQIKVVFAKLGVRREAGLVAMLTDMLTI